MIKLTRDELQTVVDFLQVQNDTLFEMIVDKSTTEKDREEYEKDERAIRKFLLAAMEKGLDIRKKLVSTGNKIKHIEEA